MTRRTARTEREGIAAYLLSQSESTTNTDMAFALRAAANAVRKGQHIMKEANG